MSVLIEGSEAAMVERRGEVIDYRWGEIMLVENLDRIQLMLTLNQDFGAVFFLNMYIVYIE